ncbi:MAG: formylglycine-generating enzyme family protein [Deltaproteobacteria bacterium]|nr:formylglycine-generating enzyme family protein [Deltaproteobacteria bacterium]
MMNTSGHLSHVLFAMASLCILAACDIVKIDADGPSDLQWRYSRPAGVDLTLSEVTVAQYRACVEAVKCAPPKSKNENKDCNWGHAGRDNHPVNCVDLRKSKAFCEWAGGRLPSEDEWYAEASNGGRRRFAWGDVNAVCDPAAIDHGGHGCGRDSTRPVCSISAGNSVSGFCDMSGGVWEWTSTRWSPRSSSNVLRGGSWFVDKAEPPPATYRMKYFYSNSDSFVGLRCARASKKQTQVEPGL